MSKKQVFVDAVNNFKAFRNSFIKALYGIYMCCYFLRTGNVLTWNLLQILIYIVD